MTQLRQPQPIPALSGLLLEVLHRPRPWDGARIPEWGHPPQQAPSPTAYSRALEPLARAGLIVIDERALDSTVTHWWDVPPWSLRTAWRMRYSRASIRDAGARAIKMLLRNKKACQELWLDLALAEAEGHLGRMLALHRFNPAWASSFRSELQVNLEMHSLRDTQVRCQQAISALAAAYMRGTVTVQGLMTVLKEHVAATREACPTCLKRLRSTTVVTLSAMSLHFCRISAMDEEFVNAIPRRTQSAS